MTRMPSLNALRTFHAVARTQSLTAAAGELGVTASAVSRQIRSLEECVGVALLVRDGRGMRLTTDGRALQTGLADAFAQIAKAVRQLQRPARGSRLRIVVPPMFAACWLMPRLERFTASQPETEVILIDIAEKVPVMNHVDLVISWGLLKDESNALAERLSDPDEVFPVCVPGLCQGNSLDGATLLHYETVGASWGWPGWPEFIEAVGLDRTKLRNGPRLTPALLLDAARRGKGVILANDALAHDDLVAGRLVRPVAGSMETDHSYWLLMSRASADRSEVSAFRSWLKEEFAACFNRGGTLAA